MGVDWQVGMKQNSNTPKITLFFLGYILILTLHQAAIASNNKIIHSLPPTRKKILEIYPIPPASPPKSPFSLESPIHFEQPKLSLRLSLQISFTLSFQCTIKLNANKVLKSSDL